MTDNSFQIAVSSGPAGSEQAENIVLPPLARGRRAYLDDPLTYLNRGRNRIYSWWVTALYPFAARPSALTLHYPVRISRPFAHEVAIGHAVMLGKDAWLNTVGLGTRDVKILIGDNCNIGARCIFSAKNRIEIASDVMFATSVLIQDHQHAYDDPHVSISRQGVTPGGRIRIDSGCWIGQGAAIVCNEGELVIGANCVIASNALVTRSYPPNSVIVGNPARLARQFDSERGVWVGGEAGRPRT